MSGVRKQLEYKRFGQNEKKPDKKPRKRIWDKLKKANDEIEKTIDTSIPPKLSRIIVVSSLFGGVLFFGGSAVVDSFMHKRVNREINVKAFNILDERETRDREVLKLMSELCFGRKNAILLLSKLRGIDKAEGLYPMEGSENRSDNLWAGRRAMNKSLAHAMASFYHERKFWFGFCAIANFGHPPFTPWDSNQHGKLAFGTHMSWIIELYESGKLDSLMDKAEKGELK